jgi:Putative  PD-(D/E)XK family member, (DUF4420)
MPVKPASQHLRELTSAGLETDVPGYHVRRCLPESALDLFLGRELPTGRCALIMQINMTDIPAGLDVLSTRAVSVELQRLPSKLPGSISIIVLLLESALEEEYCAVVDHLFRGLANVRSGRDGARLLVARLRAWLAFFSRDGRGMAENRQRGLLGEIHTLRLLAANSMDFSSALQAWTGPDRDDRDFTFPGRYAEVKTNMAGARDYVRVSNEFQLCVDPGADLFLRVVTLVETPRNGTSLPALISAVRGELASDPTSLVTFEEKLSAAGYSDAHFERAAISSYNVTLNRSYKVTPTMPAICARTLQPGVLHVSYDLDLSACASNLVSEELFFDNVRLALPQLKNPTAP